MTTYQKKTEIHPRFLLSVFQNVIIIEDSNDEQVDRQKNQP